MGGRLYFFLAALALCILVRAQPVAAHVLKIAELNTEQIAALDRARTVVIMPGGILEEHGHVPSYSTRRRRCE